MHSLNKLLKKLFITALVGLCLFPSAVFGQGKLSVRIPAEISIEADQFAIGDIATVSGGDENSVERIRHVSLGFAPRVGMMREILRENISLALAAAGFNSIDIILDVPSKILIKRTAQSVSQNALREAVEKAILPQFTNENVTAKITKIDLPETLDLPTGNVEIRAVNFQGVVRFNQPTIVSLEIRVDGKVLRRLPANVTVEAFADVFILAHDLASGTRINEVDLVTKNIRLEKSLSSYLRQPSELAGKKLLKNLTESTPLTTDAVTADAVIKAGDSVSIMARSGGMQIAIIGEARASGRIGDRIAVKNTQSGVILQATVIDEHTVKLNF